MGSEGCLAKDHTFFPTPFPYQGTVNTSLTHKFGIHRCPRPGEQVRKRCPTTACSPLPGISGPQLSQLTKLTLITQLTHPTKLTVAHSTHPTGSTNPTNWTHPTSQTHSNLLNPPYSLNWHPPPPIHPNSLNSPQLNQLTPNHSIRRLSTYLKWKSLWQVISKCSPDCEKYKSNLH